MRVLYIGDDSRGSNSAHRAAALERIGHTVERWNPATPVAGMQSTNALRKLHQMAGFISLEWLVFRWLKLRLESYSVPIDLVWVDSGELLSPRSVKLLKAAQAPVVIYNSDDPTGLRDGQRFYQLRRSVRFYDLFVTVRKPTADELYAAGQKNVMITRRGYDEVVHAPLSVDERVATHFQSDVVFVGTWMRGERREDFLNELRKAGLGLRIWGGRWDKSRNQELVKSSWGGRALVEREYVQAIAGANIAIGMLSRGNRDEHTVRSAEIPFAGGLLCAQRTSEHLAMFKDGEEAVFWSSPEECVRLCRELLSNEERRRQIVASGMRRVRQLKVGNEDVCQHILDAVFR